MNIVVYGGSFNPPCLHHREIAKALADDLFFNKVIVIPCGERSDKKYVDTKFRMQIVEFAFGGIPNVFVELFNLRDNLFTSNYHLEEMYKDSGEIWHCIGSDLIAIGDDGINAIQRRWTKGSFIWENLNFVVIPRIGFPFEDTQLPPKCRIVSKKFDGSSSELRSNIRANQDFKHLVDPKTYDLILTNKLYKR